MKRLQPTVHARGFSLAELMVVIAVIAIIAALTIPNISAITTNSHYAKNERNAQNVAALAIAAKAAGASTNGWNSLDNLINELEDGINIPSRGGAEPMRFQLTGLTVEDRQGLADYVTVQQGNVVYLTASN